MRSLQLYLNHQWNFLDDKSSVGGMIIFSTWWSDKDYLMQGVSLFSPLPDLTFFLRCFQCGFGDQLVSGWWSPADSQLPMNPRELLAVKASEGSVCGFMSQEVGLLKVSPFQSGSAGDSSLSGREKDHFASPLHHGETECS